MSSSTFLSSHTLESKAAVYTFLLREIKLPIIATTELMMSDLLPHNVELASQVETTFVTEASTTERELKFH